MCFRGHRAVVLGCKYNSDLYKELPSDPGHPRWERGKLLEEAGHGPTPTPGCPHTHTHTHVPAPALKEHFQSLSERVLPWPRGTTRIQFQPVSGSASPSHCEKAGPRFLFSVCPTSDRAGARQPHSFLKRAARAGSRRRCLRVLGPAFALSPPLRRKPGPGLKAGSLVYITYHPSKPTHNFHVSPSAKRSNTGEAVQVRQSGRTRCPRWPRPWVPLGPSSIHSACFLHSLRLSSLPRQAAVHPAHRYTWDRGGPGTATLKCPLDGLPSALRHGVISLGG